MLMPMHIRSGVVPCEPRRFGGGELRIFDTVQTEGVPTATERYQLVYPIQNQMVFFQVLTFMKFFRYLSFKGVRR